jgi:hypothetical protein
MFKVIKSGRTYLLSDESKLLFFDFLKIVLEDALYAVFFTGAVFLSKLKFWGGIRKEWAGRL